MKLARVKTDAGIRLAAVIVEDGSPDLLLDIGAADSELPGAKCGSIKQLLATEGGLARAAQAAEKAGAENLTLTGTLLAPIGLPGKVICIGLNYRDHAEESGAEIPTEPVCFSKFSSAVTGPECPIQLPAVAHKVDYEAELVVVIGTTGRNISKENAFAHVAGYTNGHDVSARDWQIGRPGGQWLMGKTPDTFAPIGPWLVTGDEVADPHNLNVKLRLNEETMQDGNTREFIFDIPELIAHLSQLITLEAGDIIFTGTPPGVGGARKPPIYLKAGDSVEVEIDGLGILRNSVEAL